MKPERYRLEVVENPDELALVAAQGIVQAIQARLQVAEYFSLLLAGGSTPKAL